MTEDNKNNTHADDESIPYRGFSKDSVDGALAPPSTPVLSYPSPTPVKATPLTLKTRLMNLMSPRQTDINQLIRKLEVQFEDLQMEVLKYRYGKNTEEDLTQDPDHPVNSSQVSHEIHYVGRSALDTSIIQLSTFLVTHDMFGAITELWLSNNQICDSGAESLAQYLEMPRCPIQELWLGQNDIGPNGVALISAALSSNKRSRLKCLGLNQNPIENAGAGCLAQMLRKNHTLITVDVHGCIFDTNASYVEEAYGCKVIKMSDGKEYVARVDTSTAEERGGYVTDQRLLDAIATFSAFNKINPTREQAISGLNLRNRRAKAASSKAQQDSGFTNANEEEEDTMITSFISQLRSLPLAEQLTDEERSRWKDCEWERLYVEIERARVARSRLADRLEIHTSDSIENFAVEPDKEDKHDDAVDEDEEEILGQLGAEKEERMGRDLDDEIVSTESRSQRDLKLGIAGSSFLSGENRAVKKSECESAPKNPTESAITTILRDEVDLGDGTGVIDKADVKFV